MCSFRFRVNGLLDSPTSLFPIPARSLTLSTTPGAREFAGTSFIFRLQRRGQLQATARP